MDAGTKGTVSPTGYRVDYNNDEVTDLIPDFDTPGDADILDNDEVQEFAGLEIDIYYVLES